MSDNESVLPERLIAQRKIIHVDMDAFYASVEQRDDPGLRGRPVVVAWRGNRSVVCAASYEARKFGVRSAMSAIKAERLCPDAIFVPPDFNRYREASRQIRAIFLAHTTLVEPLSLDEAYLDVTHSVHPHKVDGFGSATALASHIRSEIFNCTQLTASAGIAPNKFLAKIASDWRKPNGQFVIKPHDIQAFLDLLPVGRIPGVGKVTEARMHAQGIRTVGQLREQSVLQLERQWGRFGAQLYALARGIDRREVCPDRPTQSISAEDTFTEDLPISAIAPLLAPHAERVWNAAKKESRIARTVVLKLKTSDFQTISRSHTPASPPASLDEFLAIGISLVQRVNVPEQTRFRLVGLGLSNFSDAELVQPDLFHAHC